LETQIIIEQYPIWYLLGCLGLGIAAAALLYYKDRSFADSDTTTKRAILPLALLRCLTVAGIAALLLSPLIKRRQIDTVKPYILILQDNSESMRAGLTPNDTARFAADLRALSDNLSNDYQVATYNFGDKTDKGFDFSYRKKTTNLSASLDELYNTYANQNVGAIIIATDGIYNQGSNPLYSGEQAGIPIYSIALGDTTPKRDLLMDRVLYNRIAYLGDKFTIRPEISARNCKGETTAINVFKGKTASGDKLFGKAVNIATNDFTQGEDAILNADAVGLQTYTIQVAPISNELTDRNNTQTIYVEVIDSRQKVLLLAHSPHPDIAAIKQAIEANRNYQITTSFANTFNGSLRDYDVVVLHGIPAMGANTESILSQLKTNNTPTWFILSAQTDPNALGKAQELIQISGGNPNNTNDSKPLFSSQNFNIFTLDSKVGRAVQEFPPLVTPFGKYQTKANAQVLMKQKIGTVPTDYALWAFSAPGSSKQAVTAGEGLWRWRLYDFRADQSYETFNELVSKTIQYLAVKNDKRKFKVNLPKTIFNENEQITLDAELYNDSYELVNEPEVNINIYDEGGKAYPFVFNRSSNAYTLNAGFFPVGSYTFQAGTVFNGQEFKANGTFTVAAIQLESMQTTANHRLLYALSEKTGGEVLGLDSIGAIANRLKNKESIKPIQYSTFKTEPFINLKWLFGLLIALLTIEWFVRKYIGGY
jgi:hypothetical protein